MTTDKQTHISKDVANKKLTIVREFNAPPEQVWKAWTESELLDQWWAPKPWKAETKTMDFKEGGAWLYAMAGPDGTKMWNRVEFHTIVTHQSFTSTDAFCDEAGNINLDFPAAQWKNTFSETATGTKVEVEITFSTEADIKKILEMGFEAGITAGHGNLDELLKK